jgi:hypothetical protein
MPAQQSQSEAWNMHNGEDLDIPTFLRKKK